MNEKYYMVGNIKKPNMTIDFNNEYRESTIQVPHIQIVNLIENIVILKATKSYQKLFIIENGISIIV